MHNTKVSLNLASDEATRIAVRSVFLEFAAGATGPAGATGEGEVVSKTAPQTPPPTHAGGQDDGSYTNSLKLYIICYLREFVNYRHPDPRRVWKGGSEPQSMTPDNRDPGDPGDPGDPRMNPFWLQVAAIIDTW